MSRRNPGTLGIWGPNGSRVVASEATWREPLKWEHQAREARERRRVFCASMADVFEDWQGPMVSSSGSILHVDDHSQWLPADGDSDVRPLTMDNVRRRLFHLINWTPNLDWLLLTKRPENIEPILTRIPSVLPGFTAWKDWCYDTPPNVWLGTTAENQEQADKRIPILLSIPAAVRFVSLEPLLGPIDFEAIGGERCPVCSGKGTHCDPCSWTGWLSEPYSAIAEDESPRINWVIAGGESGPNARPCDIDWLRSIRDQCQAAGVRCFVKQMGSHPFDSSQRIDLHHSKGEDPSEWPEDLRVQEFPSGIGVETTNAQAQP